MPTADQVKNLIKAHYECDDERFRTVILQIAANEARQGHGVFARELKNYADKPTKSHSGMIRLNQQNPMLAMTLPELALSDLVVSDDIRGRISRIIREFKNRSKLHQYGLGNRRKILIEGDPGTGKTFTASIIASELSLPLYTVQMDKLVSKFMGETSVKLRQIFDSIEDTIGVYFFDEFDAIGADRGIDNEVGEMRRILNSFLLFIEQDMSDSIIIAATNSQRLLDQALFRRFDDVLHYVLPTDQEIRTIYEMRLSMIQKDFVVSNDLIRHSLGLSHAEIIRVCSDAVKHHILNDEMITEDMLIGLIDDRMAIYSAKEA